jgi:hypothetical protein
MTPSGGSDTRMRWRREEGPARHYVSEPRGYSIIWDPEGWHLWWEPGEGSQLLEVFSTLRAAKQAAEERG